MADIAPQARGACVHWTRCRAGVRRLSKKPLGAPTMISFKKTTCRVLIASLLTLSFHTAQAGLIGPEQAGAPAPVDHRGTVLTLLDRSDVASQLQAAGVDPRDARARVATMTD